MRVGRHIVGALLMLLAAVGTTAAQAQFAWFADAVELTRIDTATGDRATHPSLGGIDALAPDADGAAWFSAGGRLVRLDSTMSAVVDVAVPWAAPLRPAVLAADIAGPGAWWAQGRRGRSHRRRRTDRRSLAA